VAARGDRFVIRSYSPARTVGGGAVIEPVAVKRRRHAAGIEALAVGESGTLDARVLQRLEAETRPVVAETLAQAMSESAAPLAAALARLVDSGAVVATSPDRWLSARRWTSASEAIARDVRAFATKYPARYGIPKGELKSGLKSLDAALFDAAFDTLINEGDLEMRAERVRPAGEPWQPPAATMAVLEKAEAQLEAAGYLVPENDKWQAKLGAQAAEVVALGLFLGRLVRVSQDLTYTARQMEELRKKLAGYFETRPAMTVGDFRDLTGASRKYAVPLLEHCDRVGWTMRSGDERRKGGRLGPA